MNEHITSSRHKEDILQFLENQDVPYTLFEHEAKYTIEDCLLEPGLAQPGVTMPRNILLTNRQQTAFYLLIISPRKPFRTAVVSKLLGVSRLSFAPPERLMELMGLLPGAVSPLALLFDREKQVQLVVDDDLLSFEKLWFHPAVNTASVEIATRDFLRRVLPGMGRTPCVITIADTAG